MVKYILTHENADFDAVASQLAAYKLNPKATPVLPRKLNRNVREFLALYGGDLPFVKPDTLRRRRVAHVTIVDTQSVHTVRGMKPDTPITFIDHHPLQRSMPPHWQFKGEPTGANVTLFYTEMQALGVALSPVEATLMMLGVYEDTGSLTYATTTVRDLKCAAWLLKQAVDLDIVRKFLHMPLSDDQRALFDRLLASADTVEMNGRPIVIAAASAPDLVEELSTIAHRLRDLLEPAGLFLLVALAERLQLVARSTTDDVDVSVVAQHFGGGGHSRAAAALVRDRSMEATRAELLDVLPQAIRPRVTVGDLMSFGVQTVDIDDTAERVEPRMRRTGHEGYPVVDRGRLVGLLTRHAVDRAIDHGRGETPVGELMDSGVFTVRPDDSLEQLRRVMLHAGWGQVPVVGDEDGDVLIGIVTRTDLIKQWGQRDDRLSRQVEIAAKLEERLSLDAMRLVRAVSQAAEQMQVGAYFVGGFVRDLLLDVPTENDIDFVIERDAIALVDRLVAEHGGAYRSHARFGTATWIVAGGDFADTPGVPSIIDFVTARTEFYEHPSALPTVQHSSIKLDLHRRDFTINTLAVRLAPPPFGELLDFWGGERDLHAGKIRVLHSLSFVDDPTRTLRAARLAQRLGFEIEPRTRELIEKALPLLNRVSGARLRHELEAIFAEARPEDVLAQLETLGVLEQMHPALRADAWLCRAMRDLRRARDLPAWPALAEFSEEWWELPYFILMIYRLDEAARRAVCKRLRVRRRTIEAVESAQVFRKGSLPARPSAVVRRLEPLGDAALAAGWAAVEGEAREKIAQYAARWRHMRPLADGETLKARGLEPGPRFGEMLGRLREAWLDGEVTGEEEEAALLDRLIAEGEDEG